MTETRFPTLRQVRDALRGPMPAGFTFDMQTVHDTADCGAVGCVIGLQAVLNGTDQCHAQAALADELAGVADAFDDLLFPGPDSPYYPVTLRRSFDVTLAHIDPTDVADAIDFFLTARGETP